MRVTRRTVALALIGAPFASARAAVVPSDVGHTQDWFHEGFLNLAEDAQEAREAGQRLAIVFEQRGCPYCLEMHSDHLSQPEIEAYIRPRFRMIQLNLHGSRPVTDFDGETMEERQLARRWRVAFTPTIVFFPEEVPTPARPGRDIQVTRMAGLLPKPQFLGMFTYVAEHAHRDGTPFLTWWARRQAG